MQFYVSFIELIFNDNNYDVWFWILIGGAIICVISGLGFTTPFKLFAGGSIIYWLFKFILWIVPTWLITILNITIIITVGWMIYTIIRIMAFE